MLKKLIKRRGQKENLHLNKEISNLNFSWKKKSTKAQEEMVGFVLIVVIVAVILLILLAFGLKSSKKEAVESYEVTNFIQSFLQYTTDCRDSNDLEWFSIKQLLYECGYGRTCLDERDVCDALESELSGILEQNWIVTEQSAVKYYGLEIFSGGEAIINMTKGEETNNCKGSMQALAHEIDVYFTVCS